MTDPRNHPCEAPGCDQWGAHGFAVGKDKPLIWFCAQHKEIGAARAAPVVAGPGLAVSVSLDPKEQQGRLL